MKKEKKDTKNVKNVKKKGRKSKSKKGFTLIELLAVIVIIGIIMIIGIPAVSRYITDTRKSSYVTSIRKYVEEARNEVNARKYSLKREDTIYYIPTKCLNVENKEESPYGTMLESYVGITYKKGGVYTYYYVGRDSAGYGIDELTLIDEIDESRLVTNIIEITTNETKGKSRKVVYSDNCDGTYSDGQEVGSPVCKIDTVGGACECNEEIDGACVSYSCTGNARAKLSDYERGEVGVLSYGIGTSMTPDYNMNKFYDLEEGITTVVGYIKNKQGKEGICSANISVGESTPDFTVRYGYYIYPNKESATTSGITISGTNHLTTNTTPTITLSGMSKYTNVERVVIYLNGVATRNDIATISAGATTKTAPVAIGTNKIEFVLDKGTYSSFEIKLGNIKDVTFDISKIEVESRDGGIYTDRDVVVRVEDNSEGARIVRYQFDDGEWEKNNFITVTSNKSGTIKGRNGSEQVKNGTYNVTGIDRNIPTVTMVAKGKTTGTVATSNVKSEEGLIYTFTKGNVGISGATIYYCYDTNNTCNPNISVDGTLSSYSNVEGTYYIRYRVVSGAGASSNIETFKAIVARGVILTYNNNGGTGCTYKEATANSTWGTLCTPTKSGATFLGWFTELNGGTAITSSTIATANLDVYAKWHEPLTFTYTGQYGIGTTLAEAKEHTYTTNSTYTIESGNYQVYFFTSGTLTLNQSVNMDVFLVGGGGGGGSSASNSLGAGGGGGGYVSNNPDVTIGTVCNITIGAGGAKGSGKTDGSNGGATSFVCNSTNLNLSAAGGIGGNYSSGSGGGGGNGGSGGGGGGYNGCDSGESYYGGGGGYGGSNGNNGRNNFRGKSWGGTGGGITTCEFGQGTKGASSCDNGATMYSGGGGGGKAYSKTCPGTNASAGKNGTGNGSANTGGGGHGAAYNGGSTAGYSGVVVVRGYKEPGGYNLTYNNNGGSGCTTQFINYGGTFGTLCTPTKTNYAFLGWFTEATGGTEIKSTDNVTSSAPTTVYAHWKDNKNPTCTIKITNNGKSSGVTTAVTCNDLGDGCATSGNPTGDTGLKASKTYTVKDKANNTGTCTVTVTTQTIHHDAYNDNCYIHKVPYACRKNEKSCSGSACESCPSSCSDRGYSKTEGKCWCNGTCYNESEVCDYHDAWNETVYNGTTTTPTP